MPILVKPNKILSPRQRFAPLASVNQSHPLARGLVSWYLAQPWMFHSNTWFDMMGRNNGTLIGMAGANSVTRGWGGTSRPNGLGEMRLNGTSDYISLGNDIFDTLSSGTISLWLRPVTFAIGQVYFAQTEIGQDNTLFAIGLGTDGRPYVQSFLNPTFNDAAGATTILQLNTWSHIVVLSTGTTYRFFVNGAEEALVVFAGTNSGRWINATSAGANLYRLGFLNASYPYFASGAFDDLRIYNRPLSQVEIQLLYRTTLRGILRPSRKRLISFATPSATQTINALPAQAQWQVDTPQIHRVLRAQPTQAQWQADTPALRTVVAALPSQAQWQVDTPTIRRTLTSRPAQAQWQAVTAFLRQAGATLAAQPAQAQWQAAQPQIRRAVSAQSSQAQWQAHASTLHKTLRAQPAQAQWQAHAPVLYRTVLAQPAQAQWQVVAAFVRQAGAALAAQPAQAQWQADTSHIHRVLSAQPAQAQWQAVTVTVFKTLAARPAQAQWQVVTPIVFRTLIARPAQAQWQVTTPAITQAGRQLIQAQPAQAQWQVVAPSVTRAGLTLAAQPAQAQWQATAPIVFRTIAARPTQAQWQVTLPGLRFVLGARLAQARWQVTIPTIAGGAPQLLAAESVQAMWQAAEAAIIHGTGPILLPLAPVNLIVERSRPVVLLQRGR